MFVCSCRWVQTGDQPATDSLVLNLQSEISNLRLQNSSEHRLRTQRYVAVAVTVDDVVVHLRLAHVKVTRQRLLDVAVARRAIDVDRRERDVEATATKPDVNARLAAEQVRKHMRPPFWFLVFSSILSQHT